MRIIAGTLKGRHLQGPTWTGVRPTSDRLRETLFNVLGPRITGARVLDGYAGTGALGIEAISRGAAFVTFVDADRRAQALVAENLVRCGIERGYANIRATVATAAETLLAHPADTLFDIVLLDPPYDVPPVEALVGMDRVLVPGGLLVLEHARKRATPEAEGRLDRTRELRAGDSALAFYTCRP